MEIKVTQVTPSHILSCFTTLTGLCVVSALADDVYEQQLPIRFSRLEGVVAKAGGLTLASSIKQQPGAPIAIECEHAAIVSLVGADTAKVLDDAGGHLVVRHAGGLHFEFMAVEEGEYRLGLRGWKPNGYCGPAGVSLDGQAIGQLTPECDASSKGWFWVWSQPFQLNAGAHQIDIGGTTILWGASLDQIVIVSPTNDLPRSPAMVATPCAFTNGFAESDWFPADGVKRWISVNATTISNGCSVHWKVRQSPKDAWLPVADHSLAVLDPGKPIQFRLELEATAGGTTPWVGPASVRFEGTPRTVLLTSNARFVGTQENGGYEKGAVTQGASCDGLPDGGIRVRTENYEITFAPDGNISSLKVGTHDAVTPLVAGKGGAWLYLEGGARGVPGKPELQADGTIASRGEEACQTWTFKPDQVLVDAVSYSKNAFLLFAVPTNIVRIINARTGRDASDGSQLEKASPQYFFADGANVLSDDENQYGGGYGVRCDKDAFGASGLTLGFYYNSANAWHKRLVLHAKPTVGDALVIAASATPPEANYRANEDVRLRFPAKLLFGLSFKGTAELIATQLYAGTSPATVTQTQVVTIAEKETQLSWSFKPPKPGLYSAQMRLLDGTNAVRQLGCYFCYGMDTVAPPWKPADFDPFWDDTMKKLAAVPHDVQRTRRADLSKCVDDQVEFKTINGWPAWGILHVPKKPGRYPAVLILPPVGNGMPVGEDADDRVTLGVRVCGWNPSLPDEEAAKRAAVAYAPLSMQPADTRETHWLYYAYCTIARAYDIVAAMPEVDPKRIYITGVSQGGGLALAAASLRPQNAGALAVVPGLCRIDWRPLNGGGWGPVPADGPRREQQIKDLAYFDACNLVPRIRSRVAICVGLLDDHTPPHAAINAFCRVNESVREKRLLVNPWTGHNSWPELDKIMPQWMAADASPQR